MRFANGPRVVYSPVRYASSHGEYAVAVSASPVGNRLAVLSQKCLHFWTCGSDIVHLASVPIDGTSVDEDPATHLLWHPREEYLVVATLQRRVVFFEVSFNIQNEEVISHTYNEHILHVGSASSRVRLINEERLKTGIVTALTAAGPNCFFACTTAGVVCVIGWYHQKLLHMWSCHFLSQETHIFLPSDSVAKDSADSGRCVARGELLSGTIVDVSHSSQLKLTTLLLSNGYIILSQSNVGNDFTRDNIAFTGVCDSATHATRVVVNSRHMLIAMATHTGDVICRRVKEDLSLAFFWNGLKCLKEKGQSRLISGIQWSPDEEMLCIGFCHLGLVVVHYTSVCVYSSLSACHPQGCMFAGCVSFSWSSKSHRLLVIESQGDVLAALAFSEVVSSPSCNARGCFTPVISFDSDALRLVSYSPTEGGLALSDVVSLHSRYASENYPLMYAAVSPDGTAVVLAGTNGFLLFSRSTRRWRILRDKAQEKETVCVAQPLWLSSIAVIMPLQIVRARTYALRIYAQTYLDASALLAHVPLDRKPLQMCECHEDDFAYFLLVVDSLNRVLVWRCVISSNGLSPTDPSISVSLELVKSVSLPPCFLNPVGIFAIHPARLHSHGALRRTVLASQSGGGGALPYALIILRGSHSLVALDLGACAAATSTTDTSESLPSYTTILSSCVYRIWMDDSAPTNGNIILVFSEKGISVLHLIIVCDKMTTFPMVCEYGVGEFDEDSLPVGLSTYDGCLLTASCASDVLDFPSGTTPITCVRTAIKPLLYNYRVLGALTRTGTPSELGHNENKSVSPTANFVPLVWDDKLFYWLEHMRANGTFISNVDHYLHTLIDETPPAYIEQLDRRVAVQATILLLRRYSEFYSVVVSCVRKMDVSRWQVLLDILGSPVEFFRECLENCRFEDAAHLLRVIMVDGTADRGDASVESLGTAMTCAAQLLTCALGKRNVRLIHDLLRFMALLRAELTLHGVQNGNGSDPDMWTKLRSIVGLQQGMTCASLTEEGPLLFLNSTELSGDFLTSEMQERGCVVEFLFRKYPEVKTNVDVVATESLLSGHLLMLHDILQEFSLSLPHFVKEKLKKYPVFHAPAVNLMSDEENDKEVWMHAGHLYFSSLFDGIHDEFGLPRSARCIGGGFRRSFFTPVEEDVSCGIPCVLWTTAQSYLYSTPGVLEALLRVREQYAVWDECTMAIGIILMRKSDVVRHLKFNSALIGVLQNLVTLPKNTGYHAFVQFCVGGLSELQTESTPPSLDSDTVT